MSCSHRGVPGDFHPHLTVMSAFSPVELILCGSNGKSGLYHSEVMRSPPPSVRVAAGHSYSSQLGRCQQTPAWEPTPPTLHDSNKDPLLTGCQWRLSGDPELPTPPSSKLMAPFPSPAEPVSEGAVNTCAQ